MMDGEVGGLIMELQNVTLTSTSDEQARRGSACGSTEKPGDLDWVGWTARRCSHRGYLMAMGRVDLVW